MKRIDKDSINALRFLAVDTINKANSGHPGICMGFADSVYALYKTLMHFNPENPRFINRDRFVLSAGHGSAMLYSLLHLSTYDFSIDDLKSFRRAKSKTPGHPEYNLDLGIEVTTGPLGQGIANAVGMAIEGKHLSALFNKNDINLFDYKIYVVSGDGCLQEGLSFEALSLAGHLKLNNLVLLHDDNSITLDGNLSMSSSEDRIKRFEALGFETFEIKNGHDLDEIESILEKTKNTEKPSYVSIKTKIGYGSKFEGTSDIHGKPLGLELTKEAKDKLDYPEKEPFTVPEEVYNNFKKIVENAKKSEIEFNEKLEKYKEKYPNDYKGYRMLLNKDVSKELEKLKYQKAGTDFSTRESSQKFVLNVIMEEYENMFCGSADVESSCLSTYKNAKDFTKENYLGRNIRYGIREHAMGAIMNGICAGGVFRALGGCFMVFSDYMRPAIRLAALSNIPSIFVFTHDSVLLGEDGPTHQPIEHLASLRAIPNLLVFRPADANEVIESWKYILKNPQPAVLSLSRQKTKTLDINQKLYKNVEKGAYIVKECANPNFILISTGTGVKTTLELADVLEKRGIETQVVSMVCQELFDIQDQNYKRTVLPSGVTTIAIEAGVRMGWGRYCDEFIGIVDGFGESGTEDEMREKYGFKIKTLDDKVMEAVYRHSSSLNFNR